METQVDLSWLDVSPKKRRIRNQVQQTKRSRRGRRAVHEDFPEVVPSATAYINGNGFRAHRRRQEEVGTCGSSIPEVKEHLLATVPGLKESHPNLDSRTIARLMQPPNKGVKAAVHYKGLIPARVPAKDNSAKKGNTNSHFYSARVGYLLQMAAKLGTQALVYSTDNKNKLRVGDSTLSVDRRLNINRFYPTNDTPQYLDHDFPNPGYTITPSGYLQLRPSPTQSMTLDHLGREQFVLPTKGSSDVFLRSARSPTSVATHMNDVRHCILNRLPDQPKPVLFLLADGGPDFHPNHGINELYYSRLFRDLELDAMVVTCYAPGDSALNPIEHLWAPCTRALTSVYLPATLPGEDRPPNKQPGLSADELQNKESMVFNSAMAKVKDIYWRSLRFAGQRVSVHVEPSGEAPHPYGQDYGNVKLDINKSARQLRQSDLYPEFAFMAKHIDKRIGTVIFSKCDGAACCHCADHPPSLSAEDMSIMRNFPSPRPSADHPGHFETFLEALSSVSNILPCEFMPTFQEKGLGRCCNEGCRYVYTSKKDQRDHRLKVHGRV